MDHLKAEEIDNFSFLFNNFIHFIIVLGEGNADKGVGGVLFYLGVQVFYENAVVLENTKLLNKSVTYFKL